jgi:hypothetical protein
VGYNNFYYASWLGDLGFRAPPRWEGRRVKKAHEARSPPWMEAREAVVA